MMTSDFSWRQTLKKPPDLGKYCLQYRLRKYISDEIADDNGGKSTNFVVRPNKKLSVFQVMGLKILGWVG